MATIGEVGRVEGLTHQPITVEFSQSYRNPVVLALPPSAEGVHPATVRLSDVQEDQFNLQIQEPTYLDGAHVGETVSYLVVEAGTWRLPDGTVLEANTLDRDRLSSDGFDSVAFLGDFDVAPVVLSQVQSKNGADWVVTRERAVTEAGFDITMQEEQARNGVHTTESLGWVAIEPGSGDWDGHGFQAGRQVGVNHTGSTLRFADLFDETPQLFAGIESFNGPDPAGLRYTNLSADGAGIRVEEEQSRDGETVHVNETVSFLALEGQGTLTAEPVALVATPNPIPDPIAQGGLTVELVDVLQVPSSSDTRPLAPINFLSPAGDGSGRMFVVDSSGPVYAMDKEQLDPEPIFTLPGLVGDAFVHLGGQTGVRSIAVHPDFADSDSPGFGKLYVAYSATVASAADHPDTPVFAGPGDAPSHHDVIAELTIDPGDLGVDAGSYRELLRIEKPFSGHGLDQIAFDPDAETEDPDYGLLYAGIGDGGWSPVNADVFNQGQNTKTPLGTIIRLDPLGTNDGDYGVPADNPFLGDPEVLDEIWAFGFRNPETFSWDTAGDGKMLIADIGESNIEEINLGIAGANYGWSEREGTFVLDPNNRDVLYQLPPDDASLGFTYPVAQYDSDEDLELPFEHSAGNAVIGGFVYRGSDVPELVGKYVFGDLVQGRMFYVDADALEAGQQAEIKELTLSRQGQETTLLEILGNDVRVDLRFGQAEDGEIYVMSKRDGMIRKIGPDTDQDLQTADTSGAEQPAGADLAGMAAMITGAGVVGGPGIDDLIVDGMPEVL